MGVEKERKSTFLTALEQREKEARSLLYISIPSRNVTNMISYRVKNHQTQVKGCAGSLCTQASRLERRPFK